jgi:hypothetical protein
MVCQYIRHVVHAADMKGNESHYREIQKEVTGQIAKVCICRLSPEQERDAQMGSH